MPRRRDLPEATLFLGPRVVSLPSHAGCVAERQTRDEAFSPGDPVRAVRRGT
jgi:hypothetical protein